MGQAPASNKISLRTVPRNFPSRSGTLDDLVYLCSPETATASALTGKITDPRDLERIYGMAYPGFVHPETEIVNTQMLMPPPDINEPIELQKGPNIKSLPRFEEAPESFSAPVLLKMGDNISTDEILKAGANVLPYRSNIPELSKWTYAVLDSNFHKRAISAKAEQGGHIVIAAENYAQGSSREHAAICPRYLGQIAVIARSYARLGWQNLINFGIIPLEFDNKQDYETIETGDVVSMENIRQNLTEGKPHVALNKTKNLWYKLNHSLSDRQIEVILKGGVINYFRMPSRKPEKAMLPTSYN
jgi:aconitate hydratase